MFLLFHALLIGFIVVITFNDKCIGQESSCNDKQLMIYVSQIVDLMIPTEFTIYELAYPIGGSLLVVFLLFLYWKYVDHPK